MIRTSRHTIKFCNKNKKNKLYDFLNESKDAVQFYIDYLWENLINYECPKFISTKNTFPKDTNLSQRALKCISTQACSIIKSITERPRKALFVINKLKEKNEDFSKLQKWLDNYKLTKPEINTLKLELNSICCDLIKESNFWFLQLKSLGKKYGKIRIPLKTHRQSKKWNSKGKTLTSFLISKDYVNIRYEIEDEKVKENGIVVGADQGITTCLSLSDGQTTQKNKHGYDLSSIQKSLSLKVKGSNNFRKTQEHRKNYINWSLNQLNLSNIKKINLEKIKDIRKGKKTDRFRSHWTYTLIRDKLFRLCEEQKVSVTEQSCVYRSQRCSQCGLVRKSQRQGKLYVCECGYIGDADVNASNNHEKDLPDIDRLRGLSYNKEGFYWLETGLFDLNHKEFTVPSTNKVNILTNCTPEI